MGVQLFVNNISTTLASSCASGASSCSVTSATGMPSPTGGDWFLLTFTQATGTETSWEIVKCTARSGTTLTIVKGQESTTDTTWATAKVDARLTAGSIAWTTPAKAVALQSFIRW